MVQGLGEARSELVGEQRRTEAILTEAGTGVVALDGRGRIALINRRACEILGVDAQPGQRLPEEGPLPAAVASVASDFLRDGAVERVEEREVDGRALRLRLRRLPADTGARGAVLVLEDATAELRSARVLAWGEMARQVAHEIKNPLTPMKLAVQHLRRAWADDRPDFGRILERNADSVLEEIDRLGEIARAFARFGSPAEPGATLERVDVAKVVEDTLGLYRGGGDPIRYEAELPASLPRAWARAGELREVLVNVLENARGAMEAGGTVRITAASSGGEAWVHLDVTDTGEGIDAESLGRVFEPQFSTRTSGTGLGLAIVKRLVESWGGEVTLESQPGTGTVVHLRLATAD
jgi:two-component system, NtrC family, nitrogen regulation sensor histidine kinase NtrY